MDDEDMSIDQNLNLESVTTLETDLPVTLPQEIEMHNNEKKRKGTFKKLRGQHSALMDITNSGHITSCKRGAEDNTDTNGVKKTKKIWKINLRWCLQMSNTTNKNESSVLELQEHWPTLCSLIVI